MLAGLQVMAEAECNPQKSYCLQRRLPAVHLQKADVLHKLLLPLMNFLLKK
jgi:hypothetical protein